MFLLRLFASGALFMAVCTPLSAAEKFYTKTVQSVDAKKKTITFKPAKKGEQPMVIEIGEDVKFGWLKAKDKPCALSDIRAGDMVTVKEVDGKVAEVNTFRDPTR